jgi:hypothetical protein
VAEYGGLTMNNTGGALNILVLLALVALPILVVRSGIGGMVISAWCTTAMILRVIVHVPWGLLLLAIGFVVLWESGGNIIALLIGGWFVFKGGNYLFGSLGGVFTEPTGKNEGATTATRADLRRSGLVK